MPLSSTSPCSSRAIPVMIALFHDLLITSVLPSASSEHPTESVSLNFSKVQLDYKPQKEDGSLDGAVTFVYDIKKQESK